MFVVMCGIIPLLNAGEMVMWSAHLWGGVLLSRFGVLLSGVGCCKWEGVLLSGVGCCKWEGGATEWGGVLQVGGGGGLLSGVGCY